MTTLRVIAHSPNFESFGAEIERQTELNGASVYGAIRRLVERGYLRVTREEPAKHGTPRRYVQLTELGRELAATWGVMRRETLAAERLRSIADVLRLPDGGRLQRAADLLDEHAPFEADFDPAALVDAILGS
jgi:DNA-binding PadR family transcriptional regulator